MITKQLNDSFYSKQGDLILVRRILGDDAPLLVDIFDHLSSESRYNRFNQTLDHVAPNRIWYEALRIAQADPSKNQGLIAFVDPPGQTAEPVGAARLVQTSPGEAEVSISIRDDFQGRGIGMKLMRLLALAARDQGYRRLTATIRNDNPAIWIVFSRLPFEVKRSPDGSYSDIEIFLSTPHEPAES